MLCIALLCIAFHCLALHCLAFAVACFLLDEVRDLWIHLLNEVRDLWMQEDPNSIKNELKPCVLRGFCLSTLFIGQKTYKNHVFYEVFQ